MLIVGIDGGGTKTEVLVGDMEGRIVARARSGGSNPAFVGREEAAANAAAAFREALEGLAVDEVAHLACCVPGTQAIRRELLGAFAVPEERVTFAGDKESTFYGALGRREGVVALAGTGSFVMVGKRKEEPRSFGGWGPVVGDIGSGYALGVRLLRAAASELDGLAPATGLCERVLRYYGVPDVLALKRSFADRPVQGLTHVLSEAIAEGDAHALDIVREHAAEWACYVEQVCCQCGADTGVTIALAGGMWRLAAFRESFEERLAGRLPSAAVHPARLAPSAGAVMMAKDRLGDGFDERFVERLETSYALLEGS